MPNDAPGSLQWWGVFWPAIAAIVTVLAAVAASAAAWAAFSTLGYVRRQTDELRAQVDEARRQRAESATQRIETLEFSLTPPVVAIEGGPAEDVGAGNWRWHRQFISTAWGSPIT